MQPCIYLLSGTRLYQLDSNQMLRHTSDLFKRFDEFANAESMTVNDCQDKSKSRCHQPSTTPQEKTRMNKSWKTCWASQPLVFLGLCIFSPKPRRSHINLFASHPSSVVEMWIFNWRPLTTKQTKLVHLRRISCFGSKWFKKCQDPHCHKP